MRFLLVSADDPAVQKSVEVPDRIVSKLKVKKTINKPTQRSKSVIRKHGSIHHRNKRKISK